MIINQVSPPENSFIENRLFYKAESAVRTELRINTAGEPLAAFVAYPDSSNIVRFQNGIREYLRGFFEDSLPSLPFQNEFNALAYLRKTLEAAYYTDVDSLVLPAISVFAGRATGDYSAALFFWYFEGPRNLPLHYEQDFPIYFEISGTQAEQLQLIIDDLPPLTLDISAANKTNILQISPKAMESLFSVDLSTAKKYKIRVIAEENGNPANIFEFEELTIYIDHRRRKNQRQFIFKNPMGAMEVLFCHGRRSEEAKTIKETAERVSYPDHPQAEEFYFDTETDFSIIQNTGLLGRFAKEWHTYYQSFFESNLVFEVVNNSYVPVIIEPQDYEYLNDGIKSYGFTFKAIKA